MLTTGNVFSDIVWQLNSGVLVKAGDQGLVEGGKEGLLIITVNNDVEGTSTNMTFCKEGFRREDANAICQAFGSENGTYDSVLGLDTYDQISLVYSDIKLVFRCDIITLNLLINNYLYFTVFT